jgi:hypothetical protein
MILAPMRRKLYSSILRISKEMSPTCKNTAITWINRTFWINDLWWKK